MRSSEPPEATGWGGYSGYVADPNGHPWEIAHNPYRPLAADGSLVLTGKGPAAPLDPSAGGELAERAGFEPAMGCPIPHFQCGALGH